MKCPYCGAETKEQICEYCGSQIHVRCSMCGSNNISYRRENQGRICKDNPNQVVYRTIGLCKDCGNTWVVITYKNSIPNSQSEKTRINTPALPQKRRNGLWVFVALFAILYFFFNPIKSNSKTTPTSLQPSMTSTSSQPADSKAEAMNAIASFDREESNIEFDELQQFYIAFPINIPYVEARDFVIEFGLPYSEVKYNGSRVFQISTSQEGTAQRYNKSGLPYVEVIYYYPRTENSGNDVLSKYSFSSIEYVPRHGFFSYKMSADNKGIITRLASDIGLDLSREEQIAFYYIFRDDKNAFKK